MTTHHPAITWRRGPFLVSEHDSTIFQGGKSDEPKDKYNQMSLNFATKELESIKLREVVRGMGDSGYASEPKVIIVSLEGQSKE
jgi:hypothetical protein